MKQMWCWARKIKWVHRSTSSNSIFQMNFRLDPGQMWMFFFGVLDEDGKNMWLARTVLYVIWKISNDNRQVFDWYPKRGMSFLPQIAMNPSLDTILTCFSLVGSLLLRHLSWWRAQIWDWLDPHESRNQGTQSGIISRFVSHEQLPRFLFPIETLKHGDGMARFFSKKKNNLTRCNTEEPQSGV